MFIRIHRDEQGIALVTAMLVGMVVLSLSLVSIQLAAHNSGQSSLDRKRVQAIHAAEAGLDAYLSGLSTARTNTLQCTPPAVTLPIDANTSYQVTARFYPTFPGIAGQEMACPLTSTPASALITSQGTAGAAAIAQRASRTMQTEVRLNPIMGGFTTFAVYANTALSLQNNLTVTGNTGYDGNFYTNGDFICNNSVTDYGSVTAHGTVTLGSTCNILQDVWTSGNVTMTQSARVGHNLTSSAGSMTMLNSSSVVNNVRLAGACTGCAGHVGGTITTNSPSATPTTIPFPTINYDQAAWQAAGYTIHNEASCANALSFIRALNGSSIPYVVRITTNCTLTFSGSDNVRLGADLAIITNGAISLTQQTFVQSSSSAIRQLYLIVPRSLFSPATPPDAAATNCAGQNITFANLTNFQNVETFLYTPCNVSISNNNTGAGQVIGGTVDLRNSIAFRPKQVPGAGEILGYTPDIAYLREITNAG